MASSSGLPGWTGLLAGLLCVLACAQGLAQSVCTDTTNQRIEVRVKPRSGNGHDCNYTLFPAVGGSAATPGEGVIDYCKQLIIIDPAIIANMPQLAFKPMMERLLGPNAETAVASWIASWANGDGEHTRSGLDQIIRREWTGFRPIAVINRLDLALNRREIPLGEGRIIYQLFNDRGPRDMTLILEFKYPRLAGSSDPLENNRAWARKWQGLAAPRSAAQFRCALDEVVRSYAQRGNLQRIRTNEALAAGHWAFREFEFRDCNTNSNPACTPVLAWVELPHTPRDGYTSSARVGETNPNAINRETLQRYLQNSAVLSALQAGVHRFGTNYGHAPPIDIALDRSAETSTAWIGSRASANAADLLMSFNSCNGCHTEFKKARDILPHIRVPLGGERPILSHFLTDTLDDLAHPLPGCSATTGYSSSWYFGCRGILDGKYLWDERQHRIRFLENLLDPKKSVSLLSAAPLQYRYH